jgi:hypothetical protein
MIEHLVLVEIPPIAEPHREEIIHTFQSFDGKIPGVVWSTAGSDFSGRCQPYSVAAVVRLVDREALAAYGTHPAHLALVAMFEELGCRRIVADYEIATPA